MKPLTGLSVVYAIDIVAYTYVVNKIKKEAAPYAPASAFYFKKLLNNYNTDKAAITTALFIKFY